MVGRCAVHAVGEQHLAVARDLDADDLFVRARQLDQLQADVQCGLVAEAVELQAFFLPASKTPSRSQAMRC